MQTKVLMVCLGNICRSPLAEGILKSKIDSKAVFVDSAGTGGWHAGELPDPRSVSIGKKYGIDITNQRARQFTTSDFSTFNYIFVMDSSNKENILKLATTVADRNKVHLILDEISPGEEMDVPDPYYGGDSGFENVYDMLNQACESIANRI